MPQCPAICPPQKCGPQFVKVQQPPRVVCQKKVIYTKRTVIDKHVVPQTREICEPKLVRWRICFCYLRLHVTMLILDLPTESHLRAVYCLQKASRPGTEDRLLQKSRSRSKSCLSAPNNLRAQRDLSNNRLSTETSDTSNS